MGVVFMGRGEPCTICQLTSPRVRARCVCFSFGIFPRVLYVVDKSIEGRHVSNMVFEQGIYKKYALYIVHCTLRIKISGVRGVKPLVYYVCVCGARDVKRLQKIYGKLRV
jgi:hypothetical protein